MEKRPSAAEPAAVVPMRAVRTGGLRTIALTSGKGGTGKTTINTNLAWLCAERFTPLLA